jgi:transcriptional regulator with XRE-family HTH domain
MNVEQNKALGHLIGRFRKRKAWTQEDLEAKSGVNLRTIQRAEAGYGINSNNLKGLAEVFDVDAGELQQQAENAAGPPPEQHISLHEVKTAQKLVEILKRRIAHGWSLEIGLPDEHPYNEMIGEDILELCDTLENPPKPPPERIAKLRGAQFILSMCQQMGFGLFAGNYVEAIKVRNANRRRKITLIIAAPQADPRIVKMRSGMELDVIRDSRRLFQGGMMSGHATTYNWLEHQLLSKSDGEERVKDAFRRIIVQVIAEVNKIETRSA